MLDVVFTREEINEMGIDEWIDLSEYRNIWYPNHDVIVWNIPVQDWTMLVLKYPNLGSARVL